MTEQELDPEKGRKVAEELRKLGVSGILITIAEMGILTEAACQMDDCYCPRELGGRSHFDPVPPELPDWMPTLEHKVPKSESGQRTPDNSLLAHRLCNRIGYAIRAGIPHEKDSARVEEARRNASRR